VLLLSLPPAALPRVLPAACARLPITEKPRRCATKLWATDIAKSTRFEVMKNTRALACTDDDDAWEPLTPHESRPDTRGLRGGAWRQLVLLPFRVVLTVVVFVCAFVISKLYLLCSNVRGAKRLYAWIARLQSQCLLGWCYGFRLRVEGLENLATGPHIVVANHTAVYDAWALMAA
jgi:hypothetical protein